MSHANFNDKTVHFHIYYHASVNGVKHNVFLMTSYLDFGCTIEARRMWWRAQALVVRQKGVVLWPTAMEQQVSTIYLNANWSCNNRINLHNKEMIRFCGTPCHVECMCVASMASKNRNLFEMIQLFQRCTSSTNACLPKTMTKLKIIGNRLCIFEFFLHPTFATT
jgi:hypothetical protein